jgi:peptidoglycan/LPS O-acetylase OafA/YrhL
LLAFGAVMIAVSVKIFSDSILTTTETFFNKTWLFAITNIGFALMLPWFKELKTRNKAIGELVSHISIVSYSAYLIHLSFVIPFVQNYFPSYLPWIANYVCYIVLTLGLSTVVYKYYEKPLTGLREKLTKREMGYAAPVSIRTV